MSLLDRFRYGAPVFAPLVFVELAALGVLGMLARQVGQAGAAARSGVTPPP